MALSSLNLPIDVPWKLIAVSPDMMDTESRNRAFPFAWRSSLAIFAYEPKLEDLPQELCEERVAFLKVTATITGYQASQAETEAGYAAFPDVPTEELNRIFEEYFACYGVLLNVAVFPPARTLRRRAQHRVFFAEQQSGTQLSNPYESQGATFQAEDARHNRIVKRCGDEGELDLRRELVVTFPTAFRVEARVCYSSAAIDEPGLPEEAYPLGARPVMRAYNNDDMVSEQEVGADADQVYSLAVEGRAVNRVIFRGQGSAFSLLEFTWHTWEEAPVTLRDYPHIIDFEPKMRDLYQATSDTGEVLTASVSEVTTDKTFARTETTETGLAHTGKYTSPAGTWGQFEASHSISHTWGDTDQDIRSVQTDASRESRERHATSTNLSQMFNLLTGYHPGTNRSVFLMLPRPHILQPTDRRTFIRGLRVIEGVQDFFLIVARPQAMDGLCVEAFLETGHFPEVVEIEEPPVEFEEAVMSFDVKDRSGNCVVGPCREKPFDETFDAPAGWVIDFTKGDPGHPGVELARDGSNQWTKNTRILNYRAVSDATARAWGRIRGEGGFGDGAILDLTFNVYLKREKSRPTDGQRVTTPFFITSRGLYVCFRSGEKCLQILTLGKPVDQPEPPAEPVSPAEPEAPGEEAGGVVVRPPQVVIDPRSSESIVDERTLEIDARLLAPGAEGYSRFPAVKEMLHQIQSAISTSWRLPMRRPRGEVGFLESDYFAGRIREVLPEERLQKTMDELEEVPDQVAEALGRKYRLGEALRLDLVKLARRANLNLTEAAEVRRRLLGMARPQSTRDDRAI